MTRIITIKMIIILPFIAKKIVSKDAKQYVQEKSVIIGIN